jgi:oligo-1,6-glucosidase
MSDLPSEATWWKSAVVYQVYLRSFKDSNGDGIGDLRGLISKLDYLAELGMDVVWVTPFLQSPQHDNSYDVSDYRRVDPQFGTLDDVDELIAGLHSRGMKLMMDMVFNHTSDEHAWFQESRSSRDNPKREWYWWYPPRPGAIVGEPGAEPTNWVSYFSEPTWTFDDATGEYYLHLFSKHQPDLNWENPEVRNAVYETLNWWLDRGVDGLRMDVINMISKRLPLEDGPLRPGTPYGDGRAWFISGPRIHEYLQELHLQVIAGRDDVLITVGEMPDVTVEDAVLFTAPSRKEVDMVFQFEHVQLDHGPEGTFDVQPLQLADLKASLATWQRALAETGWNSLYWGNHDQPRAVSRFGSDDPVHRVASAKLLATVLHLHRGTPYIYQGEELGMTNYPFASLEDFRDIESLNYGRLAATSGRSDSTILDSLRERSRDNARTPMQWNGEDGAGFSSGVPWLPANPNHREINAESQLEDPDSVFHHYRRLVSLRHDLPVVVRGDFRLLFPDHEQIYAFVRSFRNEELLVLANFSGQRAAIPADVVAEWAATDRILTNRPDRPAPLSADLELDPWEARVHLQSRHA